MAKFCNKCSCGKYETAFDFDSKDIAVVAAEMHVMLPGSHEVETRKREFDNDRFVYTLVSTTKEINGRR